jgi:hypothetical protein
MYQELDFSVIITPSFKSQEDLFNRKISRPGTIGYFLNL